MNATLETIISTGLNNPECSFFVGQWFGSIWFASVIMYILAAYILFKIVEKIVIEPLLNYITKKIKSWFK